MKHGSTFILRATIVMIGLLVLGICLFALPSGIRTELQGDFDYGWIFISLYITAIPFFIALHKALKLLNLIDKNKTFTTKAVKNLATIKSCGLVISGLFILGMPYVFYVGDRDDAPGVVALSLVIIGASFIIATAAAVFQRLLQNAVDLKRENDLTV